MTVLSQDWRENELTFTIHPARGDLSTLPAQRTYNLRLRGLTRPELLTVRINGQAQEISFDYEGLTETVSLPPLILAAGDELVLTAGVGSGTLSGGRERELEKLRSLLRSFRLDTWEKARIEQDWAKITAGEMALQGYWKLSDAQMNALCSLLPDYR